MGAGAGAEGLAPGDSPTRSLSLQRQHGGQLQQAVPVLRPGGQLRLLQRLFQPQRRLLPAQVRR